MSDVDRAGFDQTGLWEHYQTCGLDSFSDSAARLHKLVRLLEPASKVLNVGIGAAQFEDEAARRGHHAVSLDPGYQAVRDARARLSELVPALVGSVSALPVADGTMDAVVVSEVLEHLDDRTMEEGLREVARVLRSGGRLIVTVPHDEDLKANELLCPCCGSEFHRWGHQQSFTAERLRSVIGLALQVDSVRVRRFVPWENRNLRGRIVEALRVALLRIGVHSSNERLLLVAHRR